MYIVIEGQDGTGKTTQIELLKKHFEEQGKTAVIMNEPDGDLPQAHDLRDIILERGYDLEPLTNILLFTAARVELWRKIAEPALRNDTIVISSRNWWSTLAYQGYGEGVSKNKIIRLTKALLPERYVSPDKAVILVAPDKARIARQNKRNKPLETFERKPSDFQEKVNNAYLKIAHDFNIPVIDASGSIEEVFATIKCQLNEHQAPISRIAQ